MLCRDRVVSVRAVLANSNGLASTSCEPSTELSIVNWLILWDAMGKNYQCPKLDWMQLRIHIIQVKGNWSLCKMCLNHQQHSNWMAEPSCALPVQFLCSCAVPKRCPFFETKMKYRLVKRPWLQSRSKYEEASTEPNRATAFQKRTKQDMSSG